MNDDETSRAARTGRGRLPAVAALVVVLAIAAGAIGYAVQIQRQNELKRTTQKAVLGNLRRLHAAIDQYQLETGRYPASLDDLVGPGKYLKRLEPFSGEDYRAVNISGADILRVTLSDGTVLRYSRTTSMEATPAR